MTAKPELKETIRSARAAPRAATAALGAIELIQDLGLLIVIGIGAIALSFLSPVFFTRLNIENLLFSSTIIAVIAIGESFVIMVAGIDLSVGAVLALSSVLSVGLVNDFGVPVAVAIAASLGVRRADRPDQRPQCHADENSGADRNAGDADGHARPRLHLFGRTEHRPGAGLLHQRAGDAPVRHSGHHPVHAGARNRRPFRPHQDALRTVDLCDRRQPGRGAPLRHSRQPRSSCSPIRFRASWRRSAG